MSEDSLLKKLGLTPAKTIVFIIPFILILSIFAFASFGGFDNISDISVVNLAGNRVSTGEFRGKIQIIEFFTTWCEYCEEITQSIALYHTTYPREIENIVFWSITIDLVKDQPNVLQSYINKNNISQYVDSGSWIFARDVDEYNVQFGVTGPPTTFLMAQNGTVIKYKEGPLTTAEIEEWIFLLS